MIDLETILILVCEAMEVEPVQVEKQNRGCQFADARSLYIFFANQHKFDPTEIAKSLNCKSGKPSKHIIFVNYHVDRIETLVSNDRRMQVAYAKCSEKIKSWTERVEAR